MVNVDENKNYPKTKHDTENKIDDLPMPALASDSDSAIASETLSSHQTKLKTPNTTKINSTNTFLTDRLAVLMNKTIPCMAQRRRTRKKKQRTVSLSLRWTLD